MAAVDLQPADPVTVVRTPDDVAVTNSWDADVLAGFGFPDGYRVAVSDDPEFDETAVVVEGGTAAGDGTDGSAGPDADGAATRTHDDLTAEGRYVRVTATDPFVVEQSMRGGDRRTENVRSWACLALAGLAAREAL